MKNDQPVENLASALFHATSASKLLVHANQQQVHAEKIKASFISADGRNAFLDTYCCGIRDSWNNSRNGTESVEVFSLKAYYRVSRNIWTGFAVGYGDKINPSHVLYSTDLDNYRAQQSASSLPVNSLLSSIDRNCHVLQFRLSCDATELHVVVNTPLFMDVVVPVPFPDGLSRHSASTKPKSKGNAKGSSTTDAGSGETAYSQSEVMAILSRFMDPYVASVAFAEPAMSNKDLVFLLADLIRNRKFLQTSLECAETFKKSTGCDLVTTAIVWPPLTAFNVIGMLYSPQALCRNAIGFFSSALPKMIPVCQAVAASLRPWESDGEQILAEIQNDDPPAVINVEYVVAYWNCLWTKWQASHPSGPSKSKKDIVVGFTELLKAIGNDNETYLPKTKTAVNAAIFRLQLRKRLRYRYVLVNPRRAKTHSLSVEEV